MVDGVVLGGADLNPSRKYTNGRKILITMRSQDMYDKRRSQRDQKVQGKGQQKHHDLSVWQPDAKYWDEVIFTDFLTPEETADILERRLRNG
jgi:hypothetical protein